MGHLLHMTLVSILAFSAGRYFDACQSPPHADPNRPTVQKTQKPQKPDKTENVMNLTEKDWKQRLTPLQYHILRRKGTERPHTGQYNLHFEDGVYSCAACGNPIFTSDAKFSSSCGWPAFSQPVNPNSVIESRDTSHGMIRTEITCAKCGSHLGHVFNDGPGPTGLRYCINSASMEFQDKEESDKNNP